MGNKNQGTYWIGHYSNRIKVGWIVWPEGDPNVWDIVRSELKQKQVINRMRRIYKRMSVLNIIKATKNDGIS